jgi:hypothetical protein
VKHGARLFLSTFLGLILFAFGSLVVAAPEAALARPNRLLLLVCSGGVGALMTLWFLHCQEQVVARESSTLISGGAQPQDGAQLVRMMIVFSISAVACGVSLPMVATRLPGPSMIVDARVVAHHPAGRKRWGCDLRVELLVPPPGARAKICVTGIHAQKIATGKDARQVRVSVRETALGAVVGPIVGVT